VLAEIIGYLIDDRRRWQALRDLRQLTGLVPEVTFPRRKPSCVLWWPAPP
jgi:hypothetical protein